MLVRMIIVFSLVLQLFGCGAGVVAVGGYMAYEHEKPNKEYTLNVGLATAYPALVGALQQQGWEVTSNEQENKLSLSGDGHQVSLTMTGTDSSDDKSQLNLAAGSDASSDSDKKADLKWGDEQVEAACKSLKWECKGK